MATGRAQAGRLRGIHVMVCDTITAVATPSGVGAIAIVRISGPQAQVVAARVVRSGFKRAPRRRRRLSFGIAYDCRGRAVDQVLVLDMPGPRSYTGEDMVELQCHGGPLVTEELLKAVLGAGARLAEPGEFTRRAFMNGRMDLTQAEAVVELIEARSEGELALAVRQLDGRLGGEVRQLRVALLDALALVEAKLDFSSDEIGQMDPDPANEVAAAVRSVMTAVGDMLATYESAREIYQGTRAVIAGKPNVGKSSLLNALLGSERAIVTSLAGTTRDVVEGELRLGGIRVRLADTAGLGKSSDPVGAIGMTRSREAIAQASFVILVFDGSRPLDKDDEAAAAAAAGKPVLAVLNKRDLGALVTEPQVRVLLPVAEVIETSAITKAGLEELRAAMRERTPSVAGLPEGTLVFKVRHRQALEEAQAFLRRALQLQKGSEPLELVAQELRDATDALGILTGEVLAEDILDRIFSRFCLGK